MITTKQISSGILVLILLLIAPKNISLAYDARKEAASANVLTENGYYLEAVGAYQDIIDKADDSETRARAILNIANIYSYYLNDYDTALKKYWLIKKQYSQTSAAENAIFNSGMVFFEKKQYPEALYNFREYLKKYPHGARRETAEFMISACPKAGNSKILRDRSKEETKEIKLPAEDVRVLLLSGVQEVRITSGKPFAVGADAFKVVTFYAGEEKLKANDKPLASDSIIIKPPQGCFLEVNGNPYRGNLHIIKGANRNLLVINEVGLEDYLQGVVPKEMSPQWPMEALKAQAVAARSFVLYHKAKSRQKDYDVSASTNFQVYGGIKSETPFTNQAVKNTKGKIMAYRGTPILAYFHANSGGMTEDAKSAWTTDIPYLKSVKDECSSIAPQVLWEKSFTLDAISQALSEKGIYVGDIEKLEISDTSPSGRAKRIRITGQKGRTVLPGNDFRMKMNPALIKSTLFQIVSNGNSVTFRGRGSGHGVGMSQWGAYIMAKQGLSFADILKHYYADVDLN